MLQASAFSFSRRRAFITTTAALVAAAASSDTSAVGLLQGAIDAVRLEPKVPGAAAEGNFGAGGTLLRKIVSLFLPL